MEKLIIVTVLMGSLLVGLSRAETRAELPVTNSSPVARQFFEQGLAKLNRLDNAGARDMFQKAIEANPDFAMAHLFRGLTAGAGQAAPYIQKALELSEKVSEAEKWYIRAYHANANNQPAQAIEALTQVLRLQPNAKRPHQFLATLLANQNKLDQARSHLDKAIKLDSQFVSAYLSRGAVLLNQGRYSLALKDYQHALSLVAEGPARINVLTSLGNCYAAMGNLAMSAKHYEEAISLAKKQNQLNNVPALYNALGRIALELGDLVAAHRAYHQGYEAAMATMAEPDKPVWQARYWHARARILARVGEFASAMTYADKIKSLIEAGASPQAHLKEIHHYLLGYIYVLEGKYESAIEHLRQANENDAFIQLLMAQAYDGKGDKAEAERWYQKVLAYHGGGVSTVLARPVAERRMKAGEAAAKM